MKLFPKGAWGYAVLLVLLFSIAAIATMQVIDFTTERFRLPEYENAVHGFSLAIWLLTMGLMFLAGALGLLAISATAEYESRHRIARIVSRMNYLSDGLLALDYQGRVRGANPAVRKLVPDHIVIGKKDTISGIFPSLTEEDTRRLLNRNSPCEIESEYLHSSGLRMLRLRSQPVEGLILVLVSDITEMHAANIRQQQAAKLQLLGRIAAGVAHDFSNILSAISGHAALMQRFGDDRRSLNDSIGVIVNETQRGVRLSRQLLVLSRSSDFDGQSSDNIADNVREAEELLRVALSAAWIVETTIKGIFPIVPLSPSQIVQIVLNLGLLATDALKKPGKLLIQLKQPDSLSHDSRHFAAIITILASTELAFSPRRSLGGVAALKAGPGSSLADLSSPAEAGLEDGRERSLTPTRSEPVPKRQSEESGRGELPSEPDASAAADTQGLAPSLQFAAMGMIDTTGVIPSVVRTLIEDAGGRLDELYASSDKSLYRICLPYASKINKLNLTPLKSMIKGPFRLKQWNILLAFSDARFEWLEKTLADLGAVVEKKVAIDTVLGAIDSGRKPDVIIADKRLFGDEADSLLKAVRKICPNSGIIVISRKPEEEALRGERGFIFLESDSGEETWMDAIVSSRQLAPPQK